MKPLPHRPSSLFSPLSAVLREIDAGIEALYRTYGLEGIKPRFSMALVGLADHGPMIIRDLAAFNRVTHAAMSQSVQAMKAAGLVETAMGPDARSILVSLSPKGQLAVPFLRAEWQATEAALAELDAALPVPLTQLAEQMHRMLEAEPAADRIARHMAADKRGRQ